MVVENLYVVVMMTDAPNIPSEQVATVPLSDGYCSLLHIDVSPELLALQQRVRETAGAAGEFTDPSEFHITLVYATGGTPTEWQQQTVAWSAVLPLIVDGVDVFETPDGYAVHATVRKTEELAVLQRQQCTLAVDDGLTLSPYSAAYIPHITLAYLRQPFAPFKVDPFPIMANKIELSNPDHDTVALMALKTAQPDKDDRLIAFGSAVKSVGDDRIGGYLVRWGSPNEKDLQREYFTKNTNFELDWFETRPLLYHHGLDKTLKSTKIGTIDTIKLDDVGMWAEAQLDLRNRYVNAIRSLVKNGVLQWSSGAMSHLVETEPDGWIKTWPMPEGSTTPTPAEPRRDTLISIKSLASLPMLDLTIEPSVKGSDVPEVVASQIVPNVPDNTSTKDVTMDDQMLAQVINAILQQVGATAAPEQMPALVAAAQEAMKGTEYASDNGATPEMAQDTAIKAVSDPVFLAKLTSGITSALSTLNAKKEAVKAAQQQTINNLIANTMKSAPPISQTPNAGRSPVEVVRDNRYAHLDADAAMFVVNTLKSAGKPVSDEMLRHATSMMDREATKGNEGYIAAKSVFSRHFSGMKADEIMASNLAANGAEYVGVAYENRVWEKVRQTVIYQQMLAMGVFMAQVPQGSNSVWIPTEGADPTTYSLPEQNDEDSTERPAVLYKAGTTVTGRRQLTPALIGAKVQYTDVMDEDALFPLAPFLTDMLQKAAQESIENVMINGDTVTTASTNLNLIDGTPSVDAKGRGPLYLAFNGLLKLPIITTTALSRDCGSVFDEDDFANTVGLLPARERAMRERLLFILDSDTINAATKIPSLKTRDVFNQPSLEEGILAQIFRIKVVESGQMALANSAGKIPAAGGTLGRILLVRPDQWAMAWKRQVTTEVIRDGEAGVNIIVSSLRFAITSRTTTGGAAVTYNVPV